MNNSFCTPTPLDFSSPQAISVFKNEKTWKLDVRDLTQKKFFGFVFYDHVPINVYSESQKPWEQKTRTVWQWLVWRITHLFKDLRFAPPVVRSEFDAFLANGEQLHRACSYLELENVQCVPSDSEENYYLYQEIESHVQLWMDQTKGLKPNLLKTRKFQDLKSKLYRDIDACKLRGLNLYQSDKGKTNVSLKLSAWSQESYFKTTYDNLQQHAQKWMKKNSPKETTDLSSDQLRQLRKLSRYDAFCSNYLLPNVKKRLDHNGKVTQVDVNKEMREEVFNLAFRTNLPVKLFIQNPSLFDLLKSHQILPWLERVGKDALKHDRENNQWLIKVDREWFPFKLGQEITFKTGRTTTVADLLHHFSSTQEKSLEFVITPSEGITDFGFYSSKYNGKTLFVSKYLEGKELDFPTYEKISAQQAKLRFGDGFDPTKPCNLVMITSQQIEKGKKVSEELRKGKEIMGIHSRITVVVNRGNGDYEMIPMGVYPRDYPDDCFDNLSFLGDTRAGVLSKLPDGNENQGKKRYDVSLALPLSEEDFQDFKEILYSLEKASAENALPFSILAKNCAYYVDYIFCQLNERRAKREQPSISYPSMKQKLEETDTQEKSLQGVINLYKRINKYPLVGKAFETIVLFLLGTGRGMDILDLNREKRVKECVKNTSFPETREVYCPAKLFPEAYNPDSHWFQKIQITMGSRFKQQLSVE